MNNYAILAAMILLPATAQAATWTSDFQRGINYYGVKDGALELTLTCDPNGAYSPPQNFMKAFMDGRVVDGSGTLQSDGQTVTIGFEQGTAFKQETEDGAWKMALSIISSPEGFSFTHNNQSVKVTPSNQLQHDCK